MQTLSSTATRPAPSSAANPAGYQRHRPEETTLYRVVQTHLDTYLAFVDIETGDAGLPTFVTDEFDAFLACGILAHGFLRLRCNGCKEEQLVAFSCPPRGLPSGRNAAASAPRALVRKAPHGRGRGPSGGPCHPQGAGAPMGAVVPDSPAKSVRRPPRTTRAGVADHSSRNCRVSH